MPHVFPWFICRVAALPVDAVEALRGGEAAALLGPLRDVEASLHAEQAQLDNLLALAVADAPPSSAPRRALVALKRDVFNRRPTVAVPDLPPAVRGSLARYRALHAADAGLSNALRAAHDRDLTLARRRFRAALQDPRFRCGLLLSSASLSAALPGYLAGSVTRLSGREEKVERGLLRYFTRAATKATPFSTFCAVLAGRLNASGDTDAGEAGEPLVLEGNSGPASFVRLNKAIYVQVVQALTTHPGIRGSIPVERTPTLREEGDTFVFLAATSDGREVFQRMRRNELLAFVVDLLSGGAETRLASVTERLVRHPEIETTHEAASAYLDRLLAVGLIRFRTGIPEQEVDWDEPLARLMESSGHPDGIAGAALLRELRGLAARFQEAPWADRGGLLGQMRTVGGMFFRRLRAAAVFPDPIYEDATAAACVQVSATAEVREALRALGEYVELTLPIAWYRTDQAAFRHFYHQAYGEAPGVPLLRYYEDFFREHYRAHLEQERAARARAGGGAPETYDVLNPFDLEEVDRVVRARAAFTERMRDLWRASPGAEEIVLTRGDLEAATGAVRSGPEPGRSATVFGHVCRRPDDGRAMVLFPHGHYAVGYGKYFSRFLYMLPEDVSAALRAENAALTPFWLAEICGDAGFNGNLHPPLLPMEIGYPTGERGNAAQQLAWADLYVAPDPADPAAVRLVHEPSGTSVLPVDLGFLSPQRRPALYGLLMKMTPPLNFDLNAPSFPEPPAIRRAAPGVRCRPRISYEGRVVLARRCWFIPGEHFPLPAPGEGAADYFLRVNRWRAELGVPEEVFARVIPVVLMPHAHVPPAPRTDGGVGKADLGEESGPADRPGGPPGPGTYSRDFVKPQYVDFRSPLLVKLFARLPSGLLRYEVVFEEVLPRAGQLPRLDDGRHAVEMVLQVGVPHASAAAGPDPQPGARLCPEHAA